MVDPAKGADYPRDDGRYKNWSFLGKGGHANVYKAMDEGLGCPVAIKVLNTSAARNKSLVEGMKREVLISRELRHPNICPIHDLYAGPNGTGIVMDLLSGCDLKEWLDRHRRNLAATLTERFSIFQSAVEAMAFAHRSIIHRDLKPANIFLLDGDAARPVIMDFGISLLGADEQRGRCGTPRYMAPEQWLAPEKVDHRADIWELGMLGYEMFTDSGKPPPNSLRDVVRSGIIPKVQISDIPLPSTFCPAIPPQLDQLLLQMMAYAPEDRPQSLADVLPILKTVEFLTEENWATSAETIETLPIPAGAFILGSMPNVENANEKPMRRATVSDFRITPTPVTNGQYRHYMQRCGKPPAPFMNTPGFERDDQPVVGLTWEEACAFASWVGGVLPTEVQWEYAARAGVKLADYPWGNDLDAIQTRANIDGVWSHPSPVNSYTTGKNAFGLWDCCGNVWEWCLDTYVSDRYTGMAMNIENPPALNGPGEKVVRGGSFQSFASMGRCAFRGHVEPTERRMDIGFRVVLPEGSQPSGE
ncbi:MAG: bifunctional serine/threonine-protein kinase/formylglycine-generating enzyme family protein [Magnetovibrionaceae bacterium]